jgi:hypothetical protein
MIRATVGAADKERADAESHWTRGTSKGPFDYSDINSEDVYGLRRHDCRVQRVKWALEYVKTNSTSRSSFTARMS